jgi:hypothetical protein
MKKSEIQREKFEPNNVPLIGSLGILALGDVGFEAWRKAKRNHNSSTLNEEK